jgi:cytidylate kinase
MPDKLIPAIEQRVSALVEVTRRAMGQADSSKSRLKPTITVSREFGCEAYPMTEKLKSLLEKKTGEPWALMDKALLEAVARNHNLSEEILSNLGAKSTFMDEVISTFTPKWKSDKDYYRLLCRHIVSLATAGNVIIVGRGASIVTRSMENCFHFRMVASEDFKIKSIAIRLGIALAEAKDLVQNRQKQRDKFMRDFLNADGSDPQCYHMVFNNGKIPGEKIAETIFHFMF